MSRPVAKEDNDGWCGIGGFIYSGYTYKIYRYNVSSIDGEKSPSPPWGKPKLAKQHWQTGH